MTPSPSHTSRGRAPLAAVAVALGLSGLPVAATVSTESFSEAVVQRAIDSRPAEHAGAAARNRTEPSEAEDCNAMSGPGPSSLIVQASTVNSGLLRTIAICKIGR